MNTYRWHHAAGADTVVEAGPSLEVGVLSLVQHVLVAVIIGLLVGHPIATVHFDGVTATEVAVQLGTVTAALVVTALEVAVLVEDNLHVQETWIGSHHYEHSSMGGKRPHTLPRRRSNCSQGSSTSNLSKHSW